MKDVIAASASRSTMGSDKKIGEKNTVRIGEKKKIVMAFARGRKWRAWNKQYMPRAPIMARKRRTRCKWAGREDIGCGKLRGSMPRKERRV